MKKNKALSLLLVTIIMLSTCFAFFVGANADSSNLLETYDCNPRFTYGISPWGTLLGSISQSNKDSADGDGYCALLTNRTQEYSNAHLTGDKMLQIFSQQGSGTYYYSFYVKCVNINDYCMLSPTFELYYQGAQDTAKTGKWLTDPSRKGFAVTGTRWTKIEIEFDLDITFNKKPLVEAKIYSIQRDFENNAIDLMFDNFTLVKKSNNTATPSNSFSNVTPNKRTGIGAIYYHAWFKSLENWWLYDNSYAQRNDRASVQEARSLSPKAYHSRMPFFAKLNTQVTSSKYIKGDLSAGVVEFPEFTQQIWQQEMEFAIEAGIDFMAYLWSQRQRTYNASAYQYHIKTKGLNGRIQMCAILQYENQDIATMAKAMCEPYWYKIDNMPVVYIFGGSTAATDTMISKIRRNLAQAQKAKFGAVGEPAYIIVMGANSYSESVRNAARGIDATSWYAFNKAVFTEREQSAAGIGVDYASYYSLIETSFNTMVNMADVAKDGYMGISPLITLGWDTLPRVDNPPTWTGGGTVIAARPTSGEITQNVLDILNWNRKNKDVFKCNTVLIYAWNEFNEGGWICPTAAVDSKGNIIKNEDGTNRINRTHLDAVKAGIEAYRKASGEAFNVTVDVGDQVNIPTLKPTIVPTETERPTARPTVKPTVKPTVTPSDDNADDKTTEDKFSFVFLIPVAVAVTVSAAVVVFVIIKKKKEDKESDNT